MPIFITVVDKSFEYRTRGRTVLGPHCISNGQIEYPKEKVPLRTMNIGSAFKQRLLVAIPFKGKIKVLARFECFCIVGPLANLVGRWIPWIVHRSAPIANQRSTIRRRIVYRCFVLKTT